MLKVLVGAYACEPNKGSEPGVGWNWAKQIAKFAEVWVITRANNREVIEEELKKNPEPNLHFVYVDLPRWLRFWKKGQRGVHLYYYLWQFALFFKARKLAKEIKFDIAHHITFVNDWIFSGLSLLNIPFLWGPIGSHPPIPLKFLLGKGIKVLEIIRRVVQTLFRYLDSLLLFTTMKSKKIIFISKDIVARYPFRLLSDDKFFVQTANGIIKREVESYKFKHSNNNLKIIAVGRLIYFKGFHLAILAFSKIHSKIKANAELLIVGMGMDKALLNNLVIKHNIQNKVRFIGNIPRMLVLKKLSESDIFLFPSFEGGGMVVLEAMACGLPVVCLDYGGPGEVVTDECGIKVKPITFEQTVNDLAEALLKLARDPELRRKMGEAGRRRVMEYYTWEKKGEFIKKVYEEVLGRKL